MKANEDYFVKYWPTDGKVEVFSFLGDESLFAWIQEHKGEKFSVHKATILLDFS